MCNYNHLQPKLFFRKQKVSDDLCETKQPTEHKTFVSSNNGTTGRGVDWVNSAGVSYATVLQSFIVVTSDPVHCFLLNANKLGIFCEIKTVETVLHFLLPLSGRPRHLSLSRYDLTFSTRDDVLIVPKPPSTHIHITLWFMIDLADKN